MRLQLSLVISFLVAAAKTTDSVPSLSENVFRNQDSDAPHPILARDLSAPLLKPPEGSSAASTQYAIGISAVACLGVLLTCYYYNVRIRIPDPSGN